MEAGHVAHQSLGDHAGQTVLSDLHPLLSPGRREAHGLAQVVFGHILHHGENVIGLNIRLAHGRHVAHKAV